MGKGMLESLLLAKELGGNSHRTNLCLDRIAQLNLTLGQLRASLAEAEREREEAREGAAINLRQYREQSDRDEEVKAYWHKRAEAAGQERDTLKAENADLLAALQVVKEDRQKWWGVAVERNRQICDLKAELESAKRFNGVSLMAHEKVNLKLRAQLTTSRKKGYRQGVEWAMILTREYADCSSTQEERDSLVKLAQQIERHMRAESSTLPRTYEHKPPYYAVLMDENYDLRAQLDTSREEGYRQGMEKAAEILDGYANDVGKVMRLSACDTPRETYFRTASELIRAESSTLPRTYEQEGCLCQSCGERYTLDVSVPDGIWEEIKPDGKPKGAGLLCPHCIIKRVLSLPRTYEQGAEVTKVVTCSRRGKYGDREGMLYVPISADCIGKQFEIIIRALPTTPKDAESEIGNGGAIDDDGDMSA